MRFLQPCVLLCLALICAGMAASQDLTILATSPSQNSINIDRSTSVAVDFNQAIDIASVGDTTFIVQGNMSGRHFGNYTFENSNARAVFNPTHDFLPGEIVTVTLKSTIKSAGGFGATGYLSKGHVFTFTVAAASGLGHIYPKADFALSNISIAYGLAVGDYDGDWDVDIAGAGWNNYISVLNNDGSGGFTAGASQGIIGTLPHAITAADFNLDRFIDVASANQWNDSIAVLINNDNGSFFLRDQRAGGNNPNDIASGDFNGDGYFDVAITNRNAGTVSVYFSDGIGDMTLIANYTIGGEPFGIYCADVDNDYSLDLVAVSRFTNTMMEMMNNGTGGFSLVGPTPVGNGPTGVISAIMDDNNYPDYVVSNYTDGTITVFYRGTDGIYGSDTFATQRTPRYMTPVDIDGDGDLDVALCNYDSSKVSIHYNDGTGDLTAYQEFTAGDHPYRVAAADVDGDGDMEIITSNYYSDGITVIGPMPLMVVSWGDVNISISDMVGRDYGKDGLGVLTEEIPTGYYYESGDHDSLVIHEPAPGAYTITFVEDNAPKTPDKDPATGLYASIIKIDGSAECVVVSGDESAVKNTPYVYTYEVAQGYHYINGDANRDEQTNVGDAVYIINYVFKAGPAPFPVLAGDANCDHDTNVGDAVYMINYVFKGGNKPCCCTLCGDDCN